VPPQGVDVEAVVLLCGFLQEEEEDEEEEEESATWLSSDHVHCTVVYMNYVYGECVEI
jgi:hypothetical protein